MSHAPFKDGMHISNELSVVVATAMAVGASSSEIVETRRTLYSPDGTITIIRTNLTLTFIDHGPQSPYLTPEWMTIAAATKAILMADWPYAPASPSNLPPSPITIPTTRSSSPSPISIPTTRSSSPHADANTMLCDQIRETSFNKETASNESRRILRRDVPPADRWYCVTRGLRVGVFQGCKLISAFTYRIAGSQVVYYPCKGCAEAAFDVALQANLVQVLYR
ncbi:hypothetical protein FIBSPDRAFT_968256 [Athelia psychrophila]|uniref:Uncharacterized protein n=1 Tax=Athelia psychrophila TaxID=1759441 RepID=A0A167UU00_9AGAM|nr:hypothetical protein FIBSPDRAFT_968256 [Fibularhizoctonia sp. CBS 109695]